MANHLVVKKRELTTDQYGPGTRYTLFVQGCIHDCDDCPVPERKVIRDGKSISIDNIIRDFKHFKVNAVTILGGEPFLQAESVANLVTELHRSQPELNIWLYTAYTAAEIYKFMEDTPSALRLLEQIDVLVTPLNANEPTVIEAFCSDTASHSYFKITLTDAGEISLKDITDSVVLAHAAYH